MPTPPLRIDPTVHLSDGFDAIRAELGIPTSFPDGVLAEAHDAASRGPAIGAVADRRDVPLITIDPPASTDLDQAVSLARRAGGGYVVRYAIADVAAFVAPGGAVDTEARRRGVTIYLPDGRSPLHPPVLSEGAASLLPDGERQALLWEIDLDADAEPLTVRVERATVRSRAKLSYGEVQHSIDAGTADDQLVLLAQVGRLREERERDRGGMSLPLPDQQVVEIGGRYHLEYRAPLPVEGWNAQISLLTGMCAARLMIDTGVGVLRTLPPPSDDTVAALRRQAHALGVPWPDAASYADTLRALDPTIGTHAAFVAQATRLFRGAGYSAFDVAPAGRASPPERGGAVPHGGAAVPQGGAAVHAAVASSYAHVTAPLRRLVDRFANEVVLAACAGTEPPGWARDALHELPSLMGVARQREGAADRMARDLVEASVLAGCIGTRLEGVVVDLHEGGAQVQIREPAVMTRIAVEGLELGEEVCLRVVSTDLVARTVTFDITP